jgi:integrase/recombinase XerD
MLYESAARADEVLCWNVEDLNPQDKRGKITAKGGAAEWIHWQSGSAQLLPCLIARHTRGPLFLTDRKAPAGTPTLDICPETSRARLSYRRAEEEILEENTWLLANALASPEDIEDLDGWTLHRLRHSALTHDAEDGTCTPMLLARSRHASVRSLERYARPGVDAVAQHVASRAPAAADEAGPEHSLRLPLRTELLELHGCQRHWLPRQLGSRWGCGCTPSSSTPPRCCALAGGQSLRCWWRDPGHRVQPS